MKKILSPRAGHSARAIFIGIVAWMVTGATLAHAGLTFELDLRVQQQGTTYYFVTPLVTNAIAPAAPLGTYFIRSAHWQTNGSSGQMDLTTNGMSDGVYQPFGFSDLPSMVTEITNGTWTILFTNATTTNLYNFKVSTSGISTNLFRPTVITFPVDGSIILTNQTTFTWQGPTNWPVLPGVQTYNNSYFKGVDVVAGATNWNVDTFIPAGTNYVFNVSYQSNCVTPIFVATTPTNTVNGQNLSGWNSSTVLQNGSRVDYTVITLPGPPTPGHTCLAHYTFEDNNIAVHDFSGNGNTTSYAWFGTPPTIATNDAVAGTYAGALGGSGWFTPPDSLRSLFAGSFSVSLWLKTSTTYGQDTDPYNNAAGIVSDVNNNDGMAVLPMGQTGSKLLFYTGGDTPNTLHSQASINTGQYVHVVTTRDQQTGEKRIYVNGVLDSVAYGATNLLNGSSAGALTIGFNNFHVFTGKLDEIQFYSGVLSSNEVALLHSYPGTNIADTLQVDRPVARYDFEITNAPGTDSSGHNNDANCGGGNGSTNVDTFSTNSAVGRYARQYVGNNYICFTPGAPSYDSLSNALSGSFTISAWVNTTNAINSDYANAYFGLPILFAYRDNTNQMVFSITGNKAAFTVGNPNGGSDTTLHSSTSVNDGSYHFLAAARNQTNGLMSLYVDGRLEATGISTNGPRLMASTIHMAGGNYVNYAGLLDDVRFYGGPLGADDLATLSGHPSLNTALGTSGLNWLTSGDTAWFTETTNVCIGSTAAAQSGSVTNYETSRLELTVNGPGTLTFYWSSIAGDPNQQFDYEFYLNDPYSGDVADLYGDNDWVQYGPVAIPSGPHTLGWIAFAYGDTDPKQAGFLDQVRFVPNPPVSLISPKTTGGNLQFSFQSLSGFNYDIQYRTNLVAGSWQTYTTVNGDGTLKNVPLPLASFGSSKQGFVRVATQ